MCYRNSQFAVDPICLGMQHPKVLLVFLLAHLSRGKIGRKIYQGNKNIKLSGIFGINELLRQDWMKRLPWVDWWWLGWLCLSTGSRGSMLSSTAGKASNYLQSIKVYQRNTGTSTNKYSCLRGSISIVCLFSYYSETPVYSVRWYKNGKEFYR